VHKYRSLDQDCLYCQEFSGLAVAFGLSNDHFLTVRSDPYIAQARPFVISVVTKPALAADQTPVQSDVGVSFGNYGGFALGNDK
jgi:hypothetical protein